MANREWLGGAAVVRHIVDITPIATNNETYTIENEGAEISYTADASATVDEIVDALVALWNAASLLSTPGFYGIEASADNATATKLILTGPTDGKEFTPTLATSPAGSKLSQAVYQQGNGPNYVSEPLNWSGGALPVDGDTIWIEGERQSLLYGLDALAGVNPTEMRIHKSFTGQVGTESDYLEIEPTLLEIGVGDGPGSSRIKIDLAAETCAIRVYGSAAGETDGIAAVQIIGTDAANTIEVYGGSVWFAGRSYESGAVASVKVAHGELTGSGPLLEIGEGATIGPVTLLGGKLRTRAEVGAVFVADGIWEHFEGDSGAVTATGGRVYWMSAGSPDSVLIYSGGDVDASRDARARTFGSTILDALKRSVNGRRLPPPRIHDPAGTITFSGGLTIRSGGKTDVLMQLPPRVAIQADYEEYSGPEGP